METPENKEVIATREMIKPYIDWIDKLIEKSTFQITDSEYDMALAKWNVVFDMYNNYCENKDKEQMKLDNIRAGEGLTMKEEVIVDDKGKAKNKYTDKTLEMALRVKYELSDLDEITVKYFQKVLPNKIKILEHKLNWIKKLKGI